MLKVGDKVKVTYTNGDQFLGRIVGETAKQWKIDFDGEEERRINKSMKVELVDDPKTPEKEVISVVPEEASEKPRKRKRSSSNTLSRKEWAIVGAALLLAAFAICVGLGYIEIGEAGIHFNF
jgi:hypothetical protein